MNCKHCGSKYTEYKGKTEAIGKITYHYYCHSCKRNFDDVIEQEQAGGKWLMTIRGDRSYRTLKNAAEIFRQSDGTFEINQKNQDKYTALKIMPKIYTKLNDYTHSYYLWYSSFQSLNDPNGMYITIEEIELNPELTEKALQNDAMKALHSHDNIFSVGNYSTPTLLDDAVAWITSNLGITPVKSGGCYVATCVYGSYDCPEVWTLRRYRDDTLASTWYGRAFIKLYYAVSPTLVKLFGETNWFRRFWKQHLDKAVASLQSKGVESTRYNDRNW